MTQFQPARLWPAGFLMLEGVSMGEAWMRALLVQAAALDGEALERLLKGLPAPVRRRVEESWFWQAHGGQEEPKGDWRVWLMMAGRGFGKTRAGAEWVWSRVRAAAERPSTALGTSDTLRIALVGANMDDVEKVMVKGESGLQATARPDEEVRWVASRHMVVFPSGARGFAYSGERPAKLRGPQHHFAWCDELAKWARPEETWDNLMLGLRLGTRPRIVVTTTPQPIPLLKRIDQLERTETTRGRTAENEHLPADFVDAVTAMYGGTRLGRQELEGEYIEEVEGALWSRALIEACRTSPPPAPAAGGRGEWQRIVIGVDPPAGPSTGSGQGGDACGILVCGLGHDGTAYVLEDASVRGLSPEGWAGAVVRAAERWRADRVVAEANQGGAMLESVLRAVERDLPLKLRHASEAKGKRAEPVAALFEKKRARFAGSFPELEDELAGMLPGGGYSGPGRSPDRADAMVWAMGELMLGQKRGEPRILLL